MFFRNYPGKFEIRQAKSGLFETRDDPLGTIGLSVVARLKVRDATTRGSSYLGGKRVKESVFDIASLIDREGVLLAAEQLATKYTVVAPECKRIIALFQSSVSLCRVKRKTFFVLFEEKSSEFFLGENGR